MKRLNHLWDSITSFDNLLLAYRKARQGKRNREEVALFGLELEKELIKCSQTTEDCGVIMAGDLPAVCVVLPMLGGTG